MSLAVRVAHCCVSVYSLSDHESLQPNSLDAYLLEVASAAQEGMPGQFTPVRPNVLCVVLDR